MSRAFAIMQFYAITQRMTTTHRPRDDTLNNFDNNVMHKIKAIVLLLSIFSTYNRKCDKNASVMACLARVRSKHVGCAYRISVWSVTIWRTVLTVHLVSWSAIAYMEPVKMPLVITAAITSHQVQTVFQQIQSEDRTTEGKTTGKFGEKNYKYSTNKI